MEDKRWYEELSGFKEWLFTLAVLPLLVFALALEWFFDNVFPLVWVVFALCVYGYVICNIIDFLIKLIF